VTIQAISTASALSGLRAVLSAGQAAAGQNLPGGSASSASGAAVTVQGSTPSGQFAASTLASLVAAQTGQPKGAASLHTHHHHQRAGDAKSTQTAGQSNSALTTNTSAAAPTPTSESPSTGVTLGGLLQTAAQVALLV
jgi:hypothetical protein